MTDAALSAPKWLAVLFVVGSLAACHPGNWRVRATHATGLCLDREVHIDPIAGERFAWHAGCGAGSFSCHAEFDAVTCEYLPICGNDGHSETHSGRFVRPEGAEKNAEKPIYRR